MTSEDVHGPLSLFQSAVLDSKDEMRHLLSSINDTLPEGKRNDNWTRTFDRAWSELSSRLEPLAAQPVWMGTIRITSPVDDGKPNPINTRYQGVRYEVRGTLKSLPDDHRIWLLNADSRHVDARQWPQEEARYDKKSRTWSGGTYLPNWVQVTYINAVVAPPTAREFFRYYDEVSKELHKKGGEPMPLARIPADCLDRACVKTINPTYRPKQTS